MAILGALGCVATLCAIEAPASPGTQRLLGGEPRVYCNAMGLDDGRILIQAYYQAGGADSCQASVVARARSGRAFVVRPAGRFTLRDVTGVFITVGSDTKDRDTMEVLLTAMTRDGRRDEFVLELEFRVAGDRIVLERGMPVRAETVIGFDRYRYGGVALVPIEAPERVTEWMIGEYGKKGWFAGLMDPDSLRFVRDSLGWSRGDTLPVQVLLDESGLVLDVLAPPWSGRPGWRFAAASGFLRRRLAGQRGSPDRLRGRSIKGWVPGTLRPDSER